MFNFFRETKLQNDCAKTVRPMYVIDILQAVVVYQKHVISQV